MFSRILIANRGEIALRIIRACQELGVETVAVFSQADKDAPYVKQATEAVCIGPPNARLPCSIPMTVFNSALCCFQFMRILPHNLLEYVEGFFIQAIRRFPVISLIYVILSFILGQLDLIAEVALIAF